ncbi:hypothetical protein KUCAC02_034828 [Chaenocephalus aceratus]|nr:hypothetical protein KUCAC02_034828 [Chaenocephalus aceratus]
MDDSTEGRQEVVESEALVEFRATLHAAIREVHVDVSAFKQRIEKRIGELIIPNGPLVEAVNRLQEENRQLRAKMEGLGRLVESLAGMQMERKDEEQSLKNGQREERAGRSECSQSMRSEVRGPAEGRALLQRTARLHLRGEQRDTRTPTALTAFRPAGPPKGTCILGFVIWDWLQLFGANNCTLHSVLNISGKKHESCFPANRSLKSPDGKLKYVDVPVNNTPPPKKSSSVASAVVEVVSQSHRSLTKHTTEASGINNSLQSNVETPNMPAASVAKELRSANV